YSVVDIAGLNRVSRLILGNAAAAAAGMAKEYEAARASAESGGRPLVAASMFGVTTPAVDAARERLEELGYEVLVFHATGAGGRVGGVLSAGPERLTAAGRHGVPQVVAPGALDMVNFGPRETVPERFEGRDLYVHNPTVTLMRTTRDEMAELGRRVAAKLAGEIGR